MKSNFLHDTENISDGNSNFWNAEPPSRPFLGYHLPRRDGTVAYHPIHYEWELKNGNATPTFSAIPWTLIYGITARNLGLCPTTASYRILWTGTQNFLYLFHQLQLGTKSLLPLPGTMMKPIVAPMMLRTQGDDKLTLLSHAHPMPDMMDFGRGLKSVVKTNNTPYSGYLIQIQDAPL